MLKIEKKLQKIHLVYHKLLIAQDLVNNLSEGSHRTKCKLCHDHKKNVKNEELNLSISTVFLNTQILKAI